MQVDFANGKFNIRCPFWANDLVRTLPDVRWSKKEKVWQAPLLRANVQRMTEIIATEGVDTTATAKKALADYSAKKQTEKKAADVGFPSWYPFRTKLERADGSGFDEFPIRAHQMKVLNKKYGKAVFGLHHDMGTGKTRTEIDYACALRMEGKIDAVVVFVKRSGRINWKEQFEGPMIIGKTRTKYKTGWSPIPVTVHLPETDDPKGFERWLNKPHDFKVLVVGIESMSAGNLHKMVEKFMLVAGKVHGIVDESSMIANIDADRTRRIIKLTRGCPFRDTMTGTPISTGPLNLFGQFQFLDPDIIGIGDYYAFRNHYAVILQKETKQGQKYPLIVGYKNIDELSNAVAPYVDEVRKSDVLDLPPKNYLPPVMCKMTKAQRDLYDKIKKEKSYMIGDQERVIKNVLELMLRLQQVASGFMVTYKETPYIGRKGDDRVWREATWHPLMPWDKNPKIGELLPIAEANRQFIIWAAYRAEIEQIVTALSKTFPKERICQIHGDIPDEQCAAYRHAYQQGDYKFMVGTASKGGMADTWTACETMIYYSNTHKMIDRAQSEDRAHRDGLDHVVDYVDLMMEKSVDVGIYQSNVRKMDLSEYIRMNIKNAGALLDGAEPASAAV